MQIYCRISSDEAKSGGNYAHFGVTGFDSRQPSEKSMNPGVVSIKKLCDGLEISVREFFDCELFDELEQEIK